MSETPRSLYRYRTLSAYSLAELVNETMWFAKPSSFNDPFDCALTIDQSKFEDSVHHAIKVGIEGGKIKPDLPKEAWSPTAADDAVFRKVKEMVRLATQNIGLCCFSEDPSSILMWSHYASNHQGFCVEYSLAKNTMLSQEVSRVRYVAKMPALGISDIAPPNVARTVETLWRTKAACWRYEREWRALAHEGNRAYPARAPVLSVIFGPRMPENDQVLLRQALRGRPKIKFKNAYLHESKFEIRLRKSAA